MSLSDYFPSLGFIGAGNMAGAIVRSVVAQGLLKPSVCAATDVIAEKAEALARELGIRAARTPQDLLASCSSVVLAIKPQDMRALLDSIRASVTPEHRIVSIAAGVPCRVIEAALGEGRRVVRVMPNTPALIGLGAAGVAAGACATPEDLRAVCALFEAVGIASEVAESDLDAVTALSGSGPAYVFKVMELLEEAGREMGLDRNLAHRFTIQTFEGAARLAASSPEPLAELRARVTSKGGTTAAALDVLKAGGLDDLFKRAVQRARERSIELAREA